MRRFPIYFSVLLLLASCGGKEPEVYKGSPAVQISFLSSTHTSATFLVKSLNAEEVRLLCGSSSSMPSASDIFSGGIKAEGDTVRFTGLTASTNYVAYAAARNGDRYSAVVSKDFATGIMAGDLYSWEKARGEVPSFADISLCTGGGTPNSNYWFSIPEKWDADRFAPHVSFEDDSGEHWLFDAFLAISGIDMQGNNYGINNNGRKSADKESWEAFASYWLGKGGAFDELDKALAAAAARIGRPPKKRQVVMMMPDPVMFEYYSDKNSSTTYWGALDGMQMDFSKVEDQLKALQWYADLVRSKFNELGPGYLELSGLYILSEELVAVPSGWNYQYKRWDRILPRIGAYLNERNEGLYWIPYRKADGTDMWQELGINTAWLQPNYYWDYNNEMPIKEAFEMMKNNGMGMELEFEYSMVEEVMGMNGIMGPDGSGKYVFSLKDVPSLRGRFREYMSGYKTAGLYGKRPIALYSGSNAMWQLGTSKNENDIQMYRELCHYIADSPLKNK